MRFRKQQISVLDKSHPADALDGMRMADEEQLLLDFQNSLKNDFPNPGRAGCPPANVLRGIALREIKLSEARPWLAHLGSCSVCYQDFASVQREAKKYRKLKAFAAVAAILLLSLALALFLRQGFGRSEVSVLDLRSYESLRGSDAATGSSGPPLILQRNTAEIVVQLPLGSPEVVYELQVLNSSTQEILLKASGAAHIVDHTTVLRIRPDLHVGSGSYILRIRRENLNWSYYSVIVP